MEEPADAVGEAGADPSQPPGDPPRTEIRRRVQVTYYWIDSKRRVSKYGLCFKQVRDCNMGYRPTIVTIGGFLGAGKTSLIVAAARLLHGRGVKAAALLNDHGAELVDASFVEANGIQTGQVAGGCFCCRLSDLVHAAEELRDHLPEVIFAEAVGSCTDISATVLQPMKLEHAAQFRVAPYTVLVDPERVGRWMDPSLDPALAFLFYKQIQEADLVCFTKTDLFTEFPSLAGCSARFLSSQTGDGVAAWLDDVLGGRFRPGGKILEIDYERYARAEAALAWLNCSAALQPASPASPASVVGPLLEGLATALTAKGFTIAHLKVMDESPTGWVKASIVRNGGQPSVQGNRNASPAVAHEILLNARAAGSPDDLRFAVETQLAAIPGTITIRSLQCFSPSPPKPERRLGYVVTECG